MIEFIKMHNTFEITYKLLLGMLNVNLPRLENVVSNNGL